MKKLIFLLIFIDFIFGVSFDMPRYFAKISSIDKNTAFIEDNDSIKIGSSGVVTHRFDDGIASIVARAIVIEKNGKMAKIRFEVFENLKQEAFPIPKILPQIGDEVELNFLYSRSLIVVPNEEIYKQIIEIFPNITFIHPDIVGAYLSYEYKPNPTRKDFRKMCNFGNAGLIFIALNKEAYFLDCLSFKILQKFKSGEVANYQLPFFTRVKDIKTIFYKLNSEKIIDYDEYYKSLIKEK